MKINFKATNIELDDRVKDYVLTKLAAIDKFIVSVAADEPIVQVEVGRTTEHHKHGAVCRAEINFHWRGRYFRSEATTNDLYAAIDEVKDELLREITTWRKKQGRIFRRGARAVKNLLRKYFLSICV